MDIEDDELELEGENIIPVNFDDNHKTYGCRRFHWQPLGIEPQFSSCTLRIVNLESAPNYIQQVPVLIGENGEIFRINKKIVKICGRKILWQANRLIPKPPATTNGSNPPPPPPILSRGGFLSDNEIYLNDVDSPPVMIKYFPPEAFEEDCEFGEDAMVEITVTQHFTNTNDNFNHRLRYQHDNLVNALHCFKYSGHLHWDGKNLHFKDDRNSSDPFNMIGERERSKYDTNKFRVSQSKRSIFLVMPYYDYPLNEYLTYNTFTEDEAKVIFRDIVQGIAWMHYFGLAHRDISIDNIMFDKHINKWKLIDFGLVYRCRKHYQRSLWHGIQYTSSSYPVIGNVNATNCLPYYCWVDKFRYIYGKQKYLAPEWWEPQSYMQNFLQPMSADIWSLGIVLCAIVFRDEPLTCGDPNQQVIDEYGNCYACPYFEVIRNKQLHSLYCDDNGIPFASEELFDLLHKMLSVNPLERPSPQEILQHPWMQLS